jgi:hypothetical protein
MEYNSKEVDAIYRKHNIFKQTTNTYGQHCNCPSKKMGDTISKGALTVLHNAQLPKKYWGYAVVYAVDCYNHLPHFALGGSTPWEAHKKSLPEVSMFCPFGCRATVFIG